MGILLPVYYVILTVMALAALYLVNEISRLSLNEFFALSFVSVCRQHRKMGYDGSDISQAAGAADISKTLSHKHEKLSNNRNATKMEAAMHYIDFSKPNWYNYFLGVTLLGKSCLKFAGKCWLSNTSSSCTASC